MKTEQIEFIMELLTKIDELHKLYRREDCKITMQESTNGKDYYTIDFELKACNSKFSDCIVFYTGDDFNGEGILRDFDNIISKAITILK